MIYPTCVVRGQVGTLFSVSKMKIKASKSSKKKNDLCRYWNAVSVGYAQYYSIVMRTITLHTKYAGALENYTKSNKITKLLTEL